MAGIESWITESAVLYNQNGLDGTILYSRYVKMHCLKASRSPSFENTNLHHFLASHCNVEYDILNKNNAQVAIRNQNSLRIRFWCCYLCKKTVPSAFCITQSLLSLSAVVIAKVVKALFHDGDHVTV